MNHHSVPTPASPPREFTSCPDHWGDTHGWASEQLRLIQWSILDLESSYGCGQDQHSVANEPVGLSVDLAMAPTVMRKPNNREINMTDTWENALSRYRYQVNLSDFEGAGDHPLGWFELNLHRGDHGETMSFEDRFRDLAEHHLEAWYEVTYWKNYSMTHIRDGITWNLMAQTSFSEVLTLPNATTDEISGIVAAAGLDWDEVRRRGVITAERLFGRCREYMESPTLDSFRKFRDMMFRSGVAVAATFPAFLDPDRFPMVDRHVARWATTNGEQHSCQRYGGPGLFTYPGLGESRLTDEDWEFVSSWTDWCRFTAARLASLTGRKWRARDVDMAVFTAQRDNMVLNPL